MNLVEVKMENFSEISRRQSEQLKELVCGKKNSERVQRKSFTKKLHQPFKYISTHTKKIREGQIPRNVKQLAGKSRLSVQNFLRRYNNREKASWIR